MRRFQVSWTRCSKRIGSVSVTWLQNTMFKELLEVLWLPAVLLFLLWWEYRRE
jgi:hypothetical protein